MKLTEKQKTILENKIYSLIKESFNENDFFENGFFERKKEKDDEHEDSSSENKKDVIMKWLDSAQELHSVLSYKLYPELTKDGARSEFSKKYRGEDDDHKPYEFSPEEINKLYNLRADFISDAGLRKK